MTQTATPRAAALDPVVEDAAFLARHGVSMIDAAPRLGYTPKSLDKYLRRHGAADVVRQLTAHNPPRQETAR